MKTFVFVCLAFAVCAQGLELTPKQKEIVKKYEVECAQESGATKEDLVKFKGGDFGENERLDKFFLCFFKKAGIVDDNGNVNVDVAVSKLPASADKAQAAAALNECKSLSGSNPAATVGKILRCYHDKTQQHIELQF